MLEICKKYVRNMLQKHVETFKKYVRNILEIC